MKKIIAAIIIFNLNGCGNMDGFTTSHGIYFMPGADWMTKEEAERVEDAMIDRFGTTQKCMDRIKVRPEWGFVDCRSDEVTFCNGTTTFNKDGTIEIVVGSVHECAISSSYAHELLHAFEWCIGIVDAKHAGYNWQELKPIEDNLENGC